MRSARRRNRSASNASAISTPATTRAVASSTSTRSAGGAGRRCAVFSSRCSTAPICGSKPTAWWKGSRSTARARRPCAGGRAAGTDRPAPARGEVILAAGSIGSIQILKLSGVGGADELKRLGVAVVRDKPGVGNNLQDHLQLRLIYKVVGAKTLNEAYRSLIGRARMGLDYALFRRGPLTMAPSQLGLFTRSDPGRERANLQFHVQPLSLDKFGDPLHEFPALTASVCNLQPTSRGFVRLRSADAADKPVIKPNYLSTDED